MLKVNGWFTSFCLMLDFFVYEFEKFSIFFHWNQIDKSVVDLQQFSKDKWMVLLIWLRSNLNMHEISFRLNRDKRNNFQLYWKLNKSVAGKLAWYSAYFYPASRHGTVLIFMLYKWIQWWGDEVRFYACFYDSFGKRLSVPLLLAYRYWNGRLQKYKKK